MRWSSVVSAIVLIGGSLFALLAGIHYWFPLMFGRRVSEFWGKRWNTPFRDLTHRFLFRPATRRLAMPVALLAAFAASGIVHELVISVPAGAGYGGPTLFFLLQAAAILAERSAAGRRAGLGGGWRGRLFAAVVLLLPAVILFHPPFVNDVVVPFLRAIGAL